MNYPGSLHNHTDYSNLRLRDSINTYQEIIDYSISLGQEVIAITEHESVSNAIKIEEYYNKIKKEHPDFKVILGNEIYLCRDGLNSTNYERGKDSYYHFILLAKDAEGHRQIRELSSIAWARSYKQGKMTRVPTYYGDLEKIIASNPGHVIGCTACLGGFLPRKLLEYNANPYGENGEALYSKILNWCKLMEGIFGKGNFYLEMQPSKNIEQKIVNGELIKLSNQLDIPYIITTDSHYLKKEDAPIHRAYLNSQDGDREVDDFYATTYLMDTDEIKEYFTYFTEDELNYAFQNIIDIKNKCQDYSLLKELKIPSLTWKEPKIKKISNYYFEKIPYLKTFYESDFDGDKVLAQAIVSKIESDKRLQTEELYKEVNENLESTWKSSEVNKTHWSAYFLNLQKIIDVCWDSGTLVGPGRGSGVGFVLLYLLDIIQINPLWETTKCFQWRFLNPDRVSVLDIDTDIEGGRRAQTLQGLRNFYGPDRVANVVTFGTEKSKSALQTAARGLGIDNDISLYLASLIPVDRGQIRTLSECFYGDEEKGFKPVSEFVKEMTCNYPELWEVAQRIEGLVCRVGEHAGGVIFVDEDFTNSTALMKVPNGDTVTQFDLHDCEKASLIKIDLLSVECLDKIHACLDLITDAGYINKEKSLRDRYEEAIGIYNIERTNPDMWHMVWQHKIQSLFQMEQQSGIQGIALIHPKSVDELAVLNSVIRLMASEKGGEQPLNLWAKYRKNIMIWLKEMHTYGLTDEEIDWLSHHSAITDGICESQEGLMSLVQEPRLGGNSLGFADKCRKGIAKKQGKLFEECEEIFYKNIKEQGLSEKLAHYVWDVLLKVQRGYSFNRSHCLAYSLIALQEMNLCFKYPIILWNTACLAVNSGSLEDNSEEEIVDIFEPEGDDLANGVTFQDLPGRKEKIRKTASTDYAKLAKAIGDTQKLGIKISLADINSSDFGFKPDIENNQILYGLKGMLNVSDETVKAIIENRPYKSPKDFYNKVKPTKQTMISLIKGGAFDNLMDRKMCMAWFVWESCDKKSRLTLQNMPSLIKMGIVPRETEAQKMAYKIYEFNRYLKANCKAPNNPDYELDDRAIRFLIELQDKEIVKFNFTNILDSKKWDKVYQTQMDVFRNWIAEDKESILQNLNDKIFLADWLKYAQGSISAWEMEALCFYYHDHELKNVNNRLYGFTNFYDLPEEPIVERTYGRNGDIKIFKLFKICGTCIAKNKAKSSVSLLTTNGVVNVKFRKEYFSLFDKQISERGADNKKHVLERSWFNRGSMIVVMGIRSGDDFIVKKYNSVAGHQLYKVDKINKDGTLILRDSRLAGEAEDEED